MLFSVTCLHDYMCVLIWFEPILEMFGMAGLLLETFCKAYGF